MAKKSCWTGSPSRMPDSDSIKNRPPDQRALRFVFFVPIAVNSLSFPITEDAVAAVTPPTRAPIEGGFRTGLVTVTQLPTVTLRGATRVSFCHRLEAN